MFEKAFWVVNHDMTIYIRITAIFSPLGTMALLREFKNYTDHNILSSKREVPESRLTISSGSLTADKISSAVMS